MDNKKQTSAPETNSPGGPKAKKAAAAKAGAKKPAAKKAGAKTAGAKKTGGGKAKRDLPRDLREFVAAHPEGWSHQEWDQLLGSLRDKGHDLGDSEKIGIELERERLRQRLQGMSGLGPRRIDALVGRFETLWSLQQASVDEIAQLPSIPRNVAERVREELR